MKIVLNFNFNMDDCPKGKMFTETVTYKNNTTREYQVFYPDTLLVLTNKNHLLKTSWNNKINRLSGFDEHYEEQPVAWCLYPTADMLQD